MAIHDGSDVMKLTRIESNIAEERKCVPGWTSEFGEIFNQMTN